MDKISAVPGCGQIKISSEILQKLNEYVYDGFNKLEISLTRNCCKESKETYLIDLDLLMEEVYVDGLQMTYIYSGSIDVSYFIDNNLGVSYVTYLNVLTGEMVKMYNEVIADDLWGNDSDVINYFSGSLGYTDEYYSYTLKHIIYDSVNKVIDFYRETTIVNEYFIPYAIGVEDSFGVEQEVLIHNRAIEGKNTLYFDLESMYLAPKDPNQLTFEDGVYQVSIKLFDDDNSFYAKTICGFIDCKTKCLVAQYLSDTLDEMKDNEEGPYTTLHMAHYALTNASSCNCDCEALCEMYQYVLDILSNTTNSNCNCNG